MAGGIVSQVAKSQSPDVSPAKPSLWYNPEFRGYVAQAVVAVVLGYLLYEAFHNARDNMLAHHMPTNFSFWNNVAGFDISQTLIYFNASTSTFGRAFFVGLLNTLLVAGLGIVFATILGFIVGIARLSSNWVVAKLALIYVEMFRNVPLLLQLLFWYNAVLRPLPAPRQSLALPGGAYLNNRGLILPNPIFSANAGWLWLALALGAAVAYFYRSFARRRQAITGEPGQVLLVSIAALVGFPVLGYFVLGEPIHLTFPVLRGFNFVGGLQVYPEFIALLLGLTIYTATFIAEIVRGGITAVSKGQREAASALGFSHGLALRLIVVPQAMRVIIPPLTNQFLNLTKNSTLAVAIAYPELAQVFMGTVLNQTGAAVQIVFVTMGVYLAISLITAMLMNIYNKRVALAER